MLKRIPQFGKCPQQLVPLFVKIISEEIQDDLGFRVTINGPLLLQLIIKKTSDVCSPYLDNNMLCSLPVPFNIYYQTSVCAIKNTRRTMEDRHVMIHNLNAMYNIEEANPSSYYAVFDGHGGRDAPELCSTFLHQFLTENLTDFLNNLPVALTNAFLKVDHLFLSHNKKQRFRGGTTALVTLLRPKEKKLYTAWVGDSQAFLYKQGQIIACVNPHTPARKDEAKRIDESGGYILNTSGTPRVNGLLTLSRAIGDSVLKSVIIGKPEVRSIPLDDTADFLVIGSDGLFDCLSPTVIAEKVYTYILNQPEKHEKIAKLLVDNAYGNHSRDNITAIVVLLKNPYQIALASPLGIARNTNCDTSNVYIADNITAAREMAREFCTSRNIVSNNDPYKFFNTATSADTAADHIVIDDDLNTDTVINPEKLKKEAKDLANNNSPNNDNNDDNNDFNTLLPNTTTNDHEKHENNRTIEEKNGCKQNDNEDDNDIDECLKDPVKIEKETVQNVSCVEDNPAESDSEDEWNYIKGDQEKQKNLSVQSETLEEALDDSMSQLNPNAAEFVPVSPTRSVPSPLCRGIIKDDEVLSFSPKRPKPVDSVPNEFEFETEIKSRPSDVCVSSNNFKNEDEADHATSNADMEKILNGKCIDDIPEFHPGSTPVKSDEFHFGPNAVPFSPRLLDQSTAFSSTKANYGDDSQEILNTSFNDSVNQISKTEDPMTTSFYAEKGDPNPFVDEDLTQDLNKVHNLPENLDEFLEKAENNEQFSETISDLPEHFPLDQSCINNDVAVIQTTDLDKISQDDEKELASPLEAEISESKDETVDLQSSIEQHFNIIDNLSETPSPAGQLNNTKAGDTSSENEIFNLRQGTSTDEAIDLNSSASRLENESNISASFSPEQTEDENISGSQDENRPLQTEKEQRFNIFNISSDTSSPIIQSDPINNWMPFNMSNENESKFLYEGLGHLNLNSSESFVEHEPSITSREHIEESSINSSDIVEQVSLEPTAIEKEPQIDEPNLETGTLTESAIKSVQEEIDELLQTGSNIVLSNEAFNPFATDDFSKVENLTENLDEFQKEKVNNENKFSISDLQSSSPFGQPCADNDIAQANDSLIENVSTDALSSFEFNNSYSNQQPVIFNNNEENVCLLNTELPTSENLVCVSPCTEAVADSEIHTSSIDTQEHKEEEITSSVKDEVSSSSNAGDLTPSAKSPEPSLDSFIDHQAGLQPQQVENSVMDNYEKKLENEFVNEFFQLNQNKSVEEVFLNEKLNNNLQGPSSNASSLPTTAKLETEKPNDVLIVEAIPSAALEFASKSASDIDHVTAEINQQFDIKTENINPEYAEQALITPSEESKTIDEIPAVTEVELPVQEIELPKLAPVACSPTKETLTSKKSPINEPKPKLLKKDEKKATTKTIGKIGVVSKTTAATKTAPTAPKTKLSPRPGPSKPSPSPVKTSTLKVSSKTVTATAAPKCAERKTAPISVPKPAVKSTLPKKSATETTSTSRTINQRPATVPKTAGPAAAATAPRPATASRYAVRSTAASTKSTTTTTNTTAAAAKAKASHTTTSTRSVAISKTTSATKTSTNHTTTFTAAKTTIPPKPRTITNGSIKPRVSLSKTVAKSADVEKQNKESANKLTASRTATSTTISQTKPANGIKAAVKKAEVKPLARKPATSSRNVTTSAKTTLTTTTKKVPKESVKPKTTVTKIEKSKENGVANVYVTEEVRDLTIVNNCETENFVKDNSQVDNKLATETTTNGIVTVTENINV